VSFNFHLVKVHGGLAYIAGHGPFDGPTPLIQGLIGRDLTVEQGYEAARLTGLSMLASLKQELGELGRITQWLRAVGYMRARLRAEPRGRQRLQRPDRRAVG
jgi:hypothetical protein